MSSIEQKDYYEKARALCRRYQYNIADFGYEVGMVGQDIYLVDMKTNDKLKAHLDTSCPSLGLGIICQIGREVLSIHFNKEYLSIYLGRDSKVAPFKSLRHINDEINAVRIQMIGKKQCRSIIHLLPSSILLKVIITSEEGVDYCRILNIDSKNKTIQYSNDIYGGQDNGLSGVAEVKFSTLSPCCSTCDAYRKKGKEYLETPILMQIPFTLTDRSFEEVVCSFGNTEEVQKVIEFIRSNLISVFPSYANTFESRINTIQQPQYQDADLTRIMAELISESVPNNMLPMDSVLSSKEIKLVPQN